MKKVFKYLDLGLLSLLIDKGMRTEEICKQMGIERRIAFKGYKALGKNPHYKRAKIDIDAVIKQRIYDGVKIDDIKGLGFKRAKQALIDAGVRISDGAQFRKLKKEWKAKHGEIPQALKDIPRTEFKKLLKEYGGIRGVSKYLDFTMLHIEGAVLYHGLMEV